MSSNSCSAANTVFGMSEASLLIIPYIKDISKSEIFSIMTMGLASGSANKIARDKVSLLVQKLKLIKDRLLKKCICNKPRRNIFAFASRLPLNLTLEMFNVYISLIVGHVYNFLFLIQGDNLFDSNKNVKASSNLSIKIRANDIDLIDAERFDSFSSVIFNSKNKCCCFNKKLNNTRLKLKTSVKFNIVGSNFHAQNLLFSNLLSAFVKFVSMCTL